MNRLPFEPIQSDVIMRRLRSAGWSIGEVRAGTRWLVTGKNGENVIHASADHCEEAWRSALAQAEAVGMAAAE